MSKNKNMYWLNYYTAKNMVQSSFKQLYLVPEDEEVNKVDLTSTFSNNMTLPIHRWFRYSAGFSAQWVSDVLAKNNTRKNILDPFAGSGTVLIEAERAGVNAIGVEAHPFVARVAQTKLFWRENPQKFLEFALHVLNKAKKSNSNSDLNNYPSLIRRCFPDETLRQLDTLKTSWLSQADSSPLSELTWLVLASILRETSPVGTAQWQYIQPNKKKAKKIEPYEAFYAKAQLMSRDMAVQQKRNSSSKAIICQEDARDCKSIPSKWADMVITSPPYANNYDYADATRLEMSFFGEINDWGDLQKNIRDYLIRSCTQHAVKNIKETYDYIDNPILQPIRAELLETCKTLDFEREKHGGKKPYHAMIAAYFNDMAKVWIALRRVTTDDALICFVVGDSAPYGIYVPVEEWLGKLAINAGFKSYLFEKTRDRNIKWKNRKHRVPLKEGRLWIEA